jgi:hypothetical protein
MYYLNIFVFQSCVNNNLNTPRTKLSQLKQSTVYTRQICALEVGMCNYPTINNIMQ